MTNDTNKRQFKLVMNNVESDLYENGWIPASVLIALADKKMLWDELNTEYEENKESAVVAYRNSRFYDMSILKTLTTPNKVMAIKAFSLYALYEENGTEEDFLMEKIKKGYNRYVLYLNNKPNFDWLSLLNYIEEREPGLSEMEKHDIMMVVTYLLGNKAPGLYADFYGKSILFNVNQNFNVTAIGDANFREELKKMERTALSELNRITGFKVPKNITVDQFVNNHETYLIRNKMSDKEKKELVDNDSFHTLYQKGLYRYIKPLTAIMREMNFNDFNFMATASVSREELMTIYGMFKTSKELGRLTDEEWELYFTASLLIMMFAKHYQELSEFYLESIVKEEEAILEKKSETDNQVSWEKEKELMQKRAKELESKLEEKDAYIEELERKLKASELQNEESESMKKEVVALRNYAYQHQQDIEPETVDSVSQATRLKGWTAKHKTVLFGGHPNTVNKLKTELPDVEFRDVDTLNRELDFLKNQEVVFLITNYFNHPFYYKLMKELQGLPDTQLVYLTGYPNVERTMNEMWAGISGTPDN